MVAPFQNYQIKFSNYFDNNATTPMWDSVRKNYFRDIQKHWYNPSSTYRYGILLEARLDLAREKLAKLLNIPANELFFHSGATEGINSLVLWSLKNLSFGDAIYSKAEHSACWEPLENYANNKFLLVEDRQLSYQDQIVEIKKKRGNANLCFKMAANNETGILTKLENFHQVCHKNNIHWVCDATQWLGKMSPSSLQKIPFWVASAHKFGGPKRIGISRVHNSFKNYKGQIGGGQENGYRAGTVDLPAIEACVDALEIASEKTEKFAKSVQKAKHNFEEKLVKSIPSIKVIHRKSERLWNTTALIMPKGTGLEWVHNLDKLGFQTSAGSSCASLSKNQTRVLRAFGHTKEESQRLLRISAHWETPEKSWDDLYEAILRTHKSNNTKQIDNLTELIEI